VLDAVDLSEVFGGGPGLVTGDQDLHRGERASRHTATFEALQSVIRLTVVSEGIRRGHADLGAEEHADQGEQHGQSAAGGEPPVPDDQRGPAAPPAAGPVLVADLRPVDAIFETSAVSYRLAHVCGQKQNGRKGERASAR